MISFNVNGKPVPKERPRLSKFGTYTPKRTVEYEKLVRDKYIENNGCMFTGPLIVSIVVVVEVPKSYSKIQKEKALNGDLKPVNRPDLDNIAKSILDSLNGVAYEDDSYVCKLIIKKLYGKENYVNIMIDNYKEKMYG